MSRKEIFSLEAANALIPRLRGICRTQFERRADIENALKSLGDKAGAVAPLITVTEADKKDVRDIKRRIISLIERYRAGWREVEDLGVVVKDPRTGLVDFLGEFNGTTVFFCWRYGEDEIAHYHGLHEGVSGRKPIMNVDKRRLLN